MNIRLNEKILMIYKATTNLIAEKGIHNTPMSAISKKAGLAVGTVYHYFESKERLINELYLAVKKEVMAEIVKENEEQQPYKVQFFNIWENYYTYLIKHPDTLSFIEQCSNTPIITAETRKMAEEFAFPLFSFFTKGIENGILKSLDLELVISLIHSSVVGVAKIQISGQLEITEERKKAAIEFTWKGLR